MRLKLVITSAVILSMTACNPSNNKANTDSEANNQEEVIQSNEESGVYFVNIKDGDKVTSPLFIEMGVKGMEVEAAGDIHEGKGHHHIIIDGTFEEAGTMVGKDETHIHYGKGQTSDTLKLSPGLHTLTMQFANGAHQSYGKEWSKTISITVTE
ncbi:DUF4399 domain-containing protein [Aurantibacillus circumpalustris]|uniref:DUF4399 domain-containing protein n=1 Tax=Aurantibacillus circumpalustris TaxID=3036359 RepID=UPI00295BE743|nr:DUF4399 domain-containing protein [Aurantibacillus circumpalustris]